MNRIAYTLTGTAEADTAILGDVEFDTDQGET